MDDTYRDIVNTFCLTFALANDATCIRINLPPNWILIKKAHVVRPPNIGHRDTNCQNEIKYVHRCGKRWLLKIFRKGLLQTDTTRILLLVLILIDVQWRLQYMSRRIFIFIHFK